MNKQLWTVALAISGGLTLAAQDIAGRDTSPHTVKFVTVDTDVKVEVLDWGGSGRPVVLLTGLGATAHVFDEFAQKLTSTYHVYGVTRRGFGDSSASASGYSADRLGDDVLAVVDSLKLDRPVLVGHSIAGQELSSIGSRHPKRVAGLIYLEAGYSYAYYDRSRGDLMIDIYEVEKKLRQFHPGDGPDDPRVYLTLIRELLETDLPALERVLREGERELQAQQKALDKAPPVGDRPRRAMPIPQKAIMAGYRKFTDIKVPILAIFALPHDLSQAIKDPTARAAAEAKDLESTGAQAKAFETGLPSARVVRLARARHDVFRSNETDVLREIHAFVGALPK